ncbi:unnamed protein product [Prorocentrum cordatum]|uniref:Spindle pole body component n=1 Tax=Prorocentrum cordatum TaxID=2364126 RepID=A0ABN9UU53_9DINO|nr:unnamed protein product [Polarella glacialis]
MFVRARDWISWRDWCRLVLREGRGPLPACSPCASWLRPRPRSRARCFWGADSAGAGARRWASASAASWHFRTVRGLRRLFARVWLTRWIDSAPWRLQLRRASFDGVATVMTSGGAELEWLVRAASRARTTIASSFSESDTEDRHMTNVDEHAAIHVRSFLESLVRFVIEQVDLQAGVAHLRAKDASRSRTDPRRRGAVPGFGRAPRRRREPRCAGARRWLHCHGDASSAKWSRRRRE